VVELTYAALREAVEGSAVAFRAVTRLEPVGGPADKLFPPTFGDEVTVPPPLEGHSELVGRRTKYAVEWRRIEGRSRLCVLLDSVPSQANRMEEALLEGWSRGEVPIPMVRVDFRGETHEDPALDLSTLCGDGTITALEAPHRLADALLRDSLLDGVPFRVSEPGRWFTEASVSNAVAVYAMCPTALILGQWDSTGPKGGLGAKFQRALVSEIVGVGVEFGSKTASRLDPAGIVKTEIYAAADAKEEWTLEADEAKLDKKKPMLLKRGGGKAGTPAVINHGNVTPTVDTMTGGVTVDYAEQTTVLSLPVLRRLRFVKDIKGDALPRGAEGAARVALAALALAAVVYGRERGWDLRSRCALRATHPARFELVPADGGEPVVFELDRAVVSRLLGEAAAKAAAAGLPWHGEPLELQPMPKLVSLIRRSRALSVVEGGDEA